MSEDKKTKVGIWMHPDMVKQDDSAYPLNGISSRSESVCNAVEFYLGYLQTGNGPSPEETAGCCCRYGQIGRYP